MSEGSALAVWVGIFSLPVVWELHIPHLWAGMVGLQDPGSHQPYQMQLAALTWFSRHAMHWKGLLLKCQLVGISGGKHPGISYCYPAAVFEARACAADVLSCRLSATQGRVRVLSCCKANRQLSWELGEAWLTQCALLQSAGSIPAVRWGAGEKSGFASKLNTELKITPRRQ